MNTGDPWEFVVVDLVFENETFGRSQVLTRYEADYNLARLARMPYLEGDPRRVVQATIVHLDPQPEVVFPREAVILQ